MSGFLILYKTAIFLIKYYFDFSKQVLLKTKRVNEIKRNELFLYI